MRPAFLSFFMLPIESICCPAGCRVRAGRRGQGGFRGDEAARPEAGLLLLEPRLHSGSVGLRFSGVLAHTGFNSFHEVEISSSECKTITRAATRANASASILSIQRKAPVDPQIFNKTLPRYPADPQNQVRRPWLSNFGSCRNRLLSAVLRQGRVEEAKQTLQEHRSLIDKHTWTIFAKSPLSHDF